MKECGMNCDRRRAGRAKVKVLSLSFSRRFPHALDAFFRRPLQDYITRMWRQ